MMRALGQAGRTILIVLSAALLLGAANDRFRFERPVESAPGFAVLELPPEVLAAAAPDLGDVRLYAAGKELAYAVESRLIAPVVRLPLFDVAVTPGQETQAFVDRGEARGTVEALTFEISSGSAFLKPVVLEASDERTNFRELARGSIFRSEAASSLRLRFAPNDRRYWRLRFDDRLSEPVTPTAVLLDGTPSAKPLAQAYAARLEARASVSDSTDSWAVVLGSTNLPATHLVFEVKDQVFSRQIRIFEPILFRDELSLHLVGEGHIERLANGSESLTVPVSELHSARLEVEVERAGSALAIAAAQLLVEPKRIVFLAPEAGALRLAYGSDNATPPHYDLEDVLNHGMPKALTAAKLGPVSDRGASAPLPTIERGPVLSPSSFRSQRAVNLPTQGSVAYLDLPGFTPEMAHRVRLVAADGRQVPFIVETQPRRTTVPLHLAPESAATLTTAKLTGLEPQELLEGLELKASAPALFQREVQVFETERDKRGPLGRHLLGSAHWERRPDGSEGRVTVELIPPHTGELLVELDNRGNPAVVLAEARGIVTRARIDFVFVLGEALTLLSDDPNAGTAHYDLSLLAEKLLASQALPAALAPLAASTRQPSRSGTISIWFWAAFVVTAGLLLAVLVRLLRSEPRTPEA